jgi:hypothetical protein
MGGEFLKPYVKIMVQAGLIIIDKNAGGNVHCVYQAQPFLYAGFGKQGFRFICDVDEFTRFLCVKPQFFGY